MNSKKLLIAFTAVSIAALIVSSFAVFAVARTYSAALAREQTEAQAEDITPPEISASLPAESDFYEITSPPETESITATEVEGTSALSETTTETVSTEVTTEETSTEVTEKVGFTLSLSGGRLAILSPDGESVYERIIDESDLRPNDREALLAGIDFPELEDAMSAVYDLIS